MNRDQMVEQRLRELQAAITLAGGSFIPIEDLRNQNLRETFSLIVSNEIDLHVFFKGVDCSSGEYTFYKVEP